MSKRLRANINIFDSKGNTLLKKGDVPTAAQVKTIEAAGLSNKIEEIEEVKEVKTKD